MTRLAGAIRLAVIAVLVVLAFIGGRAWLRDHPEYDPQEPLMIDQPDTWVTKSKFAALRNDRDECRAFLKRSAIEFTALAPAGTDECRRDDRKLLAAPDRFNIDLQPGKAQATCAIDAGLARWLHRDVQPSAEAILGSRVVRLEHLGTVNCRRIGGSATGNWSEHARGNAIDVAGFVLADGRRISVLRDWDHKDQSAKSEARFLRTIRDRACASFSTVLSPDYNAAHANHLHLDQARRTSGWSACR